MAKISIPRPSVNPIKVLIIDDENKIYQYCINNISEGFNYTHHISGKKALEIFSEFDLVLLDKNFQNNAPEDLLGSYEDRYSEGLTILRAIRKKNKVIPVIMVTACADFDSASKSLRMGALDYVEWDALLVDPNILATKMLRASRFESETKRRWIEDFSKMGLIGSSEVMLEIYQQMEVAAHCDDPVLITGHSGTGKTLVAGIIHKTSVRKDKPFIGVSLPTIEKEVATSELFGAVKGAATDVTARPGRFKDADGGTIFLDEIGDIPEALQLKLLKAIEEGKIEPLGKAAESVDVRVIAATSRDLDQLVYEGKFRKELYHRLKVIEIRMPLLSAHKEDIQPLAEFFTSQQTDATGSEIVGITAKAKKHLKDMNYENNVRGLKNIITRACKFSDQVIDIRSLLMAEGAIGTDTADTGKVTAGAGTRIDLSLSSMEQIEKVAIENTLRRTGGNKKEAAESLGISVASIFNKIKKYGL